MQNAISKTQSDVQPESVQRICADVINLVAREKRVPPRLLTHPSRCRRFTAQTRQLAMYLAHVVYGCPLQDIADIFGRNRSTVSHACALVEDRRDDPVFDAEVVQFETLLEVMLARQVRHAR